MATIFAVIFQKQNQQKFFERMVAPSCVQLIMFLVLVMMWRDIAQLSHVVKLRMTIILISVLLVSLHVTIAPIQQNV